MFTELSRLLMHRTLSMYQVSSSTVVFFVSYMHIYVPFIMYCSRLFVVEMNCVPTFKHDVVRWVTELHLSTCLSILRLVSHASRTRTRRILKLAISYLMGI